MYIDRSSRPMMLLKSCKQEESPERRWPITSKDPTITNLQF